MGNGVSSQGNVHPHDQGDIRSSVAPEQHDWQPESAVASRQETLSLQSMRKFYSGARPRGSKLSADDNVQSNAYSDTQAQVQSSTTEKNDGDKDLETDLRESRAFDDVIVEQKLVNRTASPPTRICPMLGLINLRRVRKYVMKKPNRPSSVRRKFLWKQLT